MEAGALGFSVATGGMPAVANSVAPHNELVRTRPDLARELCLPQPFDFRNEQASGARAWYTIPIFTRCGERLFVRFIPHYTMTSQRHADALRLTDSAREALDWMRIQADSGRFSVHMESQPGDIQFINNYHVLHGRTAYTDDAASGRVRHLKRLWLETGLLTDRPPHFSLVARAHWAKRKVISRLDATR